MTPLEGPSVPEVYTRWAHLPGRTADSLILLQGEIHIELETSNNAIACNYCREEELDRIPAGDKKIEMKGLWDITLRWEGEEA